ncbi:hypothetical protein ACFXPX_07335 [Kitasatospora sp. NPDC059146]|uniref:hypothetical protein n=1 Tax=Kitasatospora sp. NPDC059146 TaxID=3346741 RepID=UPI0036C2D5A7
MGFIEELAALGGLAEARRFVAPWQDVERELGIGVPFDYVEYVGHFGPGGWSNYLGVLIPGVADSSSDLVHQSNILNELLTQHPIVREQQPFPIFPEPGGLLRWGNSATAETFHWRVDTDDPDSWSTVVLGDAKEEVYEFHGPMTEFLAKLFDRRIHVPFMNQIPKRSDTRFSPSDGTPLSPRFRIEPLGYFEN